MAYARETVQTLEDVLGVTDEALPRIEPSEGEVRAAAPKLRAAPIVAPAVLASVLVVTVVLRLAAHAR